MTERITFVAFYMDVSAATMQRIHQTTSTITVTEPHCFIQTMFASARHFHPGCGRVILSDQHTHFPPGTNAEIRRLPLDKKAPMLARARAWLAYLREASGHVIFLDNDILINGDLGHVFAEEFAVALTYRDERKWPINAGINFAHGCYLTVAAAFHELWLRRFLLADEQSGVWGGDQDALRELFSEVDFARDDCFGCCLAGLAVRFLPCARYNFSTRRAADMVGQYPDAAALHFKGRRKPFMLPYYQQYIHDSENRTEK
ncbi:MAG: hypothetical protein OXG92_15740 [Chloroflexi bacterium]|nr:hypothetical protein [Chloroflexota bacterium]MCY3582309.1 hypothetical protein [Chloroflexota bacterium]MCY3717900.1 hypothetical protein [Chloroflexota bacterium]MDE2649110.1 hypothetical protein [Chloroflexota bacterium]MXX83615.1 hypothetical protein [Chloroflexota bacterium]